MQRGQDEVRQRAAQGKADETNVRSRVVAISCHVGLQVKASKPLVCANERGARDRVSMAALGPIHARLPGRRRGHSWQQTHGERGTE